MPIPGPGTAISINTIATEFGGTVPHSISEYYRGGGLVPNTPGNAAIPTSGQIALGNFYGSANRTAYTLIISANTQNYDVFTNRGPSYVAGSSDITVQINPGVTVGSSTIPAYAMLVPSAFNPGDTITIVNNGSIRGAGGGGGAGGTQTPSQTNAAPGFPGAAGGNALFVNRPTTVTNNSTIAGGGGGGGGGGAAYGGRPNPKSPANGYADGGGGGGGAGNSVGGGGVGGSTPSNPGTPGTSGTATTGGSGGAGGASAWSTGGTGGTGGGAGSAGATGATSTLNPGASSNSVVAPGGSGGAAGNYIVGNSFVTWPATGTRQGGVA